MLDFSGPWKKWPQMAPNRAGRIFFLLIQTLPTFWAERICFFRLFSFLIFWIPKFLDFQDPRSQNFGISRSPDLQIPKIPDFQVPRFPDAACACAGRILRSQPDPSPNAPRDQIRRKGPCCDYTRERYSMLFRSYIFQKATSSEATGLDQYPI